MRTHFVMPLLNDTSTDAQISSRIYLPSTRLVDYPRTNESTVSLMFLRCKQLSAVRQSYCASKQQHQTHMVVNFCCVYPPLREKAASFALILEHRHSHRPWILLEGLQARVRDLFSPATAFGLQ